MIVSDRDEPGAIYELDDEAMRFSIVSDFQKNVNVRCMIRSYNRILENNLHVYRADQKFYRQILLPVASIRYLFQKEITLRS